MTIAYISHPACLLHEMGSYHPEQPARLSVIGEELNQSEFVKIIKKYEAPLVLREQLLRAHDADYVDHIFKIAPPKGMIYLDADTAMNPYSLEAALRAAGAVVYAVDLLMEHQEKKVFCNVRPPGHHATRNSARGFCFFNNIAVGVLHALEHYALKRIAIVDFDVHHGNGTEDIIKNNKQILLCSSFQHPFYPFSGAETKSEHIINVPLPAGTAGAQYREAVKKAWFKPLRDFKPELIFFSAGFDAYIEDELANFALQEEDYYWLTQAVREIAEETAQGRIISALEGGYSLQGLGPCVAAHLRALA